MPTNFSHTVLAKSYYCCYCCYNCYKITTAIVTATITATTAIKLSYYCATDHFATDIYLQVWLN